MESKKQRLKKYSNEELIDMILLKDESLNKMKIQKRALISYMKIYLKYTNDKIKRIYEKYAKQ